MKNREQGIAERQPSFLVPTLCVGTHGCDALRRVWIGAAAVGFGTQSVQASFPRRAWEPEQSLFFIPHSSLFILLSVLSSSVISVPLWFVLI